jgi:hypothetical protein
MATDPTLLPDFDALWNFDQPESTESALMCAASTASPWAPPTRA